MVSAGVIFKRVRLFYLIHYMSFINMRPTYISTICERFSQEYGQNQSLNVMQIKVRLLVMETT